VQLNEWFNANLLTLNYNKTQYIQFRTKADSRNEISLSYDNNFISNKTNTKFLGIIIDSFLTWKAHISQLLPKLSRACYVMRYLKPIMSIDSLTMVYYSYSHSHIAYGITFWGNSSFSLQIFKSQKRIIRIMCGLRSRDLCMDVFKTSNILPLKSQYIYYFLLFTVNNGDFYHSVAHIHDIKTQHNQDLFQP
jgi:hypothetical protein